MMPDYTPGLPNPTLAAAVAQWWAAYQDYWSGAFPGCYYTTTSYSPSPANRGLVFFLLLHGTCAGGQHFYATVQTQAPVPPIQDKTQQNIGPPCADNCAGNPINTGTGNKYEKVIDYRGHGAFPLLFSRAYNSYARIGGHAQRVGANWFTNIGAPHLFIADCYQPAGSSGANSPCASATREAFLRRPAGKVINFIQPDAEQGTSQPWHAINGNTGRFTETDTGYAYLAPNGLTQHFTVVDTQSSGEVARLTSVTNREGVVHQYHYDDGHVASVTTSFGRQLTFTYNNDGRLATMTNPAGGVYQYAYDANGNLVQVTYPDGSTVHYLYENTSYPHALTGLIDAAGQRFATWHYDDQGRAILSEHAGGANRIEVAYDTNAQGQVTGADITEATGLVRHLNFQWQDGLNQFVSASAPCAQCGSLHQQVTYNGDFISSTTSFTGAKTTFTRNDIGLELSRTDAAGTPKARTITTQWNATLRRPTRITWPEHAVAFQYNTRGQITQKTVIDNTTQKRRVTTYRYNTQGLLAAVNGPRINANDVTHFTYDATGNLAAVTNALGQTTAFTRYNAQGEPLTIQLPTGAEIDLAYDARGRLISRTAAGATTRFQYDLTGQLVELTLPTGASVTYSYDAAHRLTTVTGPLGNQIHYTLNAMGHPVQTDTENANGTITQTVQRVYGELNHLIQRIGGAGQTTHYTRDEAGRATRITDPLGHVTQRTFGPLNHLLSAINPTGGQTTFAYNQDNRLTHVDDPRGLNTHYIHNGFGDLIETDSPDAGTTTYAYDSAGNRISQTDARGITTSYAYDALNRLTHIRYPDASEDVAYTYDQGLHGTGRLTGIQDQSGTTHLQYDVRGNVIQKQVTIASHSFTVGYQYDSANHLTGITYPDGLQVNYQLNAAGRITGITVSRNGTTQTVASYIQYQPFGPMTALTYGNGLTATRQYDQAYRLTAIQVPGILNWTLAHNADNNITAITNNLSGHRSQTFSYDALSRLTNAQGGYGSRAYTYDPDSNRTRGTNNGTTTEYTYASDSNHLLSVNSQTNTYDAAGHLISDGSHTYTYNDAGRLSGYDSNPNRYLYNSLGQRVGKAAANPCAKIDPWQRNTAYTKGDKVKYQGHIYTANWWSYNSDPKTHSSQYAPWHQTGACAGTPPPKTSSCGDTAPWNPNTAYYGGQTVSYEDKIYTANWWSSHSNPKTHSGQYEAWSETGSCAGSSQPHTNTNYTYFLYDQTGHLIGKYNQKGQLLKAHIWFGNRPIAVATPKAIDYVTTGQLGAPRVITNKNQTVIWRWHSGPFGVGQPNQNPSDLGQFTYNLRLPGQYHDTETGLHYNWHRYYDPRIGRYTRSDPIGLAGGVGTYLYVINNPINRRDLRGLRPDGRALLGMVNVDYSNLDSLSLQSRADALIAEANAHVHGPDYVALNLNVGSLVGGSGTVAVDRYGDVFVSPGVTFGKSVTFVSGSVTINWLDQSKIPSERQLSNFLSGNGINFTAGYWAGASQTYSPGHGWATGIGFVSPQIGMGYSYSFQLNSCAKQ